MRFTTFCCKNIVIIKLDFVAETQFRSVQANLDKQGQHIAVLLVNTRRIQDEISNRLSCTLGGKQRNGPNIYDVTSVKYNEIFSH